MKIELPLETWTDVFVFVPRSQLAKLLPHIGDEKRRKRTRQGRKCSSTIEDRQFVSFVKFYLHKCGQITLDKSEISASRRGPLFGNNAEMKLPLAEVPPISQNIKSFQKISISSYDESVFQFLEQFYHNALFTDVNLHLYRDGRCNSFMQFLPKFMPMVNSIDSINLNDKNILALARLGKENFGQKMLTSARVLLINDNFDFGCWFRHWLQTPREDNKPRVLIASNGHLRFTTQINSRAIAHSEFTSFVTTIKKDFLEANEQAVSFFVKVYNPFPSWSRLNANVQSDSVDNHKTQEKLVVIKGVGNKHVKISRYPMKASVEWIEEMEKSVEDMEEKLNNGEQKRKIELNFRTMI